MNERVRVLVVDDSAFARKVLREVLRSHARIDVVGTARDGLDALEKIAELKPDVVLLDMLMPQLDGLGVLRALPKANAPRVVVVTTLAEDNQLALAALDAGAVDLVQKPTALATDRLYEISDPLIETVLAAAGARVATTDRLPVAPLPPADVPRSGKVRMIVIGTSTGGPQALHRLLCALPSTMPVPIAVVLHIPAGYTEALAKRLDQSCALHVVEAADEWVFQPGQVVIARAGVHLKIRARDDQYIAQLDSQPPGTAHRPSVDVLFESAAQALGSSVLGVVLTGMGDDGLAGSRAIRTAHGVVLAEAESSCVVYGMPRCVVDAGLAAAQVPLDQMAAEILRQI
jgi:two-component system, chemotaxis family, protein-glutamate methylesterase/glutaminase